MEKIIITDDMISDHDRETFMEAWNKPAPMVIITEDGAIPVDDSLWQDRQSRVEKTR